MTQPKTTNFGYQEVPWNEKQDKVAEVFHSVAPKYDLMNDVLSLGVHRLWKQHTLSVSRVKAGDHVLDLAGGSGDLALGFSKKVGRTGLVVLADINASMLNVGRDRLLNKGVLDNVAFVQANAEMLPFQKNQFDCLSIAFGLRNVTDKAQALRSMYQVIKPGGKLMILEFSHPTAFGLKPIYDFYSFHFLPKMGKLFANDAESYQYLAESIRMHPNQETLKTMVEQAGFEDCSYHNLSGGIVALHIAYKY